jgi:hypothetical protein
MDEKKDYQKACIGIVKKRVDATLEGLGLQLPPNEHFDYYYGLIDFEFFARQHLGEDVVEWMKANIHPLDIVFRLAEDHGIPCVAIMFFRGGRSLGSRNYFPKVAKGGSDAGVIGAGVLAQMEHALTMGGRDTARSQT